MVTKYPIQVDSGTRIDFFNVFLEKEGVYRGFAKCYESSEDGGAFNLKFRITQPKRKYEVKVLERDGIELSGTLRDDELTHSSVFNKYIKNLAVKEIYKIRKSVKK